MKKITYLCLVAALCAGCSSSSAASSTTEDSGTEVTVIETETAETEEEPVAETIYASGGVAYGALGNIMSATNLNFILNSAYITTNYQGITPDSGTELLVINVTTENKQSTDLQMYDTDYQIQWGGESDTDYATPITYRDEWADSSTYKSYVNLDGVTGMYENSQVIATGESFTGDLVYQIPEGTRSFILLFQEYFQDESVGDLYTVSFEAALQE